MATHPRPLTGRTVLVCLIAFFGVVALANAIMIRAAVSTFGGLETSSSYQAGLAFARDAAAARAQDELHWQGKANLRPAPDSVVFRVYAREATGGPLVRVEAKVILHTPHQ